MASEEIASANLHRISRLLRKNEESFQAIADAAGASLSEVTVQALIHAPQFPINDLDSDDGLGQLIAVTEATFGDYAATKSEHLRGLANFAEFMGAAKGRPELEGAEDSLKVVDRQTGIHRTIFASEVPESISHEIESKLHYLRNPRAATHRIGFYVEGDANPFAYVAAESPLTVGWVHKYLPDELALPINDVAMVTRAWGVDECPRNTFSKLYGLVGRAVHRTTTAKCLVNAINHSLGFSGGSIAAANFYAYADAPVVYQYDESGRYRPPHNLKTGAKTSQWELPGNTFYVAGLDRRMRKTIEGIGHRHAQIPG